MRVNKNLLLASTGNLSVTIALESAYFTRKKLQGIITARATGGHRVAKEKEVMKMKNTCQKITLQKGELHIYNIGTIRLHAYKTNDFIDNEVFILEKNGKAVIIESPCFFDNSKELSEYLQDMEIEGVLIAYHGAGAAFLPDIPKYATENAKEYAETGGGKALIDTFSKTFGDIFDKSIHKITNILLPGNVTIGDISFVIKQTTEAYDIEIPEINAVYTHMLGHNCHSIIAGSGHADAMILELKSYIAKGYDLILTSHYTPEDLKDVETKISYLEKLKTIAAACPDAVTFKAKVEKQYPNYSGQNYLDMTAGFFYS